MNVSNLSDRLDVKNVKMWSGGRISWRTGGGPGFMTMPRYELMANLADLEDHINKCLEARANMLDLILQDGEDSDG